MAQPLLPPDIPKMPSQPLIPEPKADREELLAHLCRMLSEHTRSSGMAVTDLYDLVYLFGPVRNQFSFFSGAATLNILNLAPEPLSRKLKAAFQTSARQDDPVICKDIRLSTATTDDPVTLMVQKVFASPSCTPYFLILITTASEQGSILPEDLVAAKEALEATNQELQSANEELVTENAQSAQKIKESSELSNDMANLMRCTDIGVVMLDSDMQIRRFTPAASRYVHLIEKDIGRPFFDLMHLLDYDNFYWDTRFVLHTGDPVSREVIHTSGTSVRIRIFPYLDEFGNIQGTVISYGDLTGEQNRHISLTSQEKDVILSRIPDVILYYDRHQKVVWANPEAFRVLGMGPESLMGLLPEQVWAIRCKDGSSPVPAVFETADSKEAILSEFSGKQWHIRSFPVHHLEKGSFSVLEVARIIPDPDR